MSANSTEPGWQSRLGKWQWLLFLIIMGVALVIVCPEILKPNYVSWSNDTALGAYMTKSARLPSVYTGHWIDGNWIGIETPANAPTVSSILEELVVSPIFFEKIFPPFTMWLLGFSAWLLFRQLKFAPGVCIVGGLAAGLNMHCFSNATWGLGNWNVAISMMFFAFAAMVTDGIRRNWIKAAFAGLAVGMAVMEAFDSGAILSVFAGVFVLFYCWISEPRVGGKISKTVSSGLVVVVFAFLIAASTLSTLVSTSVRGIQGMGQSAGDKAERWMGATMWSLPKIETLRLIMPGLYGYRLDDYDTTPDHAGVYWGKVGEHPVITALNSGDPATRTNMAAQLGVPPEITKILETGSRQDRDALVDNIVASSSGNLQRRHTGSGEFSGLLVSILAIFALANACRRTAAPYSRNERLIVWFWGLAALFALTAAWGRYSFVYALLYKIPYVSTIRNPIKFMHPFNVAWIILAGFGLEALYRSYLKAPKPVAVTEVKPAKPETAKAARAESAKAAKAEAAKPAPVEVKPRPRFDMGWIIGLTVFAVAIAAIFWIYGGSHGSSSRRVYNELSEYIGHQGFGEVMGQRIATFAIGEIGWFTLFFCLSAGTMACIITGVLSGRRALWAWLGLGMIMFCDLSRADRPWVRYYDYKEKYSMNPVVDFLKNQPYEHRVAAKLPPDGGYALCGANADDQNFALTCHWWLENDFPYNDIECLDFDQLNRRPEMEAAYLGTFSGINGQRLDLAPPVRLWKLCNTRYVLCPAAVVPALNDGGDPIQHGFRIQMRFDLEPKPGVTEPEDKGDYTAVTNPNGKFALVELTDALPRAKLYANWKVSPDDATTLQTLSSYAFDINKNVLVSSNVPPAPAPTDADPGTVQITDYQPKDVHLHANATTPAVLLLNDRTADDWHAWVDDKPATQLHCNYIMRGVYLTPGEHTIEFRYQPPQRWLYVTLAALAAGVLLAGWTVYTHVRTKEA